jgi:hypothetical protein
MPLDAVRKLKERLGSSHFVASASYRATPLLPPVSSPHWRCRRLINQLIDLSRPLSQRKGVVNIAYRGPHLEAERIAINVNDLAKLRILGNSRNVRLGVMRGL